MDTKQPDHKQSSPVSSAQDEGGFLSDRYPALVDDVDLLYIQGNMSGRIRFIREWPAVASYIFGEELIAMDTHGGNDSNNAQKKLTLEEKAEDRRVEVFTALESLEERTVKDGVLQKENVLALAEQFGRDFIALLYTPEFLSRFPELSSSVEGHASSGAGIQPEEQKPPAPPPDV